MNLIHTLRNGVAAAVMAGGLMLAPAAHARVFVSVGVAPPAIPVYVQPPAPSYGYIWTPGYWAYGPDGYYWVDGAWVLPPYEGALWTPGYWGWGDDAYFWNPGYWGLSVGYYGGINYGFGYFGTGFYGGYWRGGRLFYNSEYNRFGFRDHNGFIYRQRVGGFDGRPGGSAFARNNGRGFSGRDFNRGASVNGRNFGTSGRNTEQVGFRNGYTGNGARSGYSGSFRDNGQQFRGGYSSQQQNRFGQGGSSAPATQYRSGSPQSRLSTGGSFGSQPRAAYSAPQGRSYSGGSFGGGARPSSSGGGNAGGFRGGGNFGGGGGFHGGGGGGGSHGGGHR